MPFDPNDPNNPPPDPTPPLPPAADTSQLPDQSPQNQFSMQQANAAMTPQVGPPVTAQPGALKGLLTNFFGGMGRAMMVHAGLPTPEQEQQRQQQQAMQQQVQQATIQMHQATARSIDLGNQEVEVPQAPLPDGTPQAPIRLPQRYVTPALVQTLKNQSKPPLEMSTVGPEHADIFPNVPVGTQVPKAIFDKALLSTAGKLAVQNNAPAKTPNEIGLIEQDLGPNATAGQKLDALQKRRMQLAEGRGIGYAKGRALYTPFETVQPGTNIPTTISNMQALQSGAPKVSMGAQTKLGGQYALFNDAYGILDKVDALADKVHLDDPGVSSRVAAGYAAIKDPAAKGMTGEILSNVFAHQPVYNTLTPDERDLVLTMAQGKAAGTGLRGIMGQAGTNEMQQRLDSALFPGGQTAASTAGLKSQTEATRQLLDRFIVGQPQVGLNAPGSRTALQTKRGGGGGGAEGTIRVQLPDGRTGTVPASSRKKYESMPGAKILP